MTGQDPIESSPPPLPIAPPTQAGPVPVELPRSKWPTVLGIIAIVLAGFGLLSVLGQAVALLIPHSPAAASQPAVLEPPAALKAIYTPIWLVLCVILLVGGIGLVNRRRWSVRPLVAWAIGDVVLTLVGLVGTLINLPAFQQQMRQQNAAMNAAMPPGASGAFEVVMVVAMCFGAAFGFAPPIFTLVWFGRRKIKDEVAGWV